MKEESEPEALAQAGPAALVFELADHLQQFVGIVVDPARTAERGRTGRSSLQRTLGVQGKSQKPAGGGGLFCGSLRLLALLNRCLGGCPGVPSGSVTSVGAGLVVIGHSNVQEHLKGHTNPSLPIWVLPVYSLILI